MDPWGPVETQGSRVEDQAVQTYMGHSKIQTTFDVYGHLFPGSHDEVRSRMDAYLARDPVTSGA
jgi:integrase